MVLKRYSSSSSLLKNYSKTLSYFILSGTVNIIIVLNCCFLLIIQAQIINNEKLPGSASLEVKSDSVNDGIGGSKEDIRPLNEENLPALKSVEISTGISDVKKGKLWIPKSFHITCCLGGTPIISQSNMVYNFTFKLYNYLIEEDHPPPQQHPSITSGAMLLDMATYNCRIFHGSYYVPPHAEFSPEFNYATHVICKCPDIGSNHGLDKNCRRLPICKNNGFRSLIDPKRCLCLQPFFGEKCEKYCDQGQRMRGLNGIDYCNCAPFYKGDECRELICLNGGREDNGRCICPAQFLGYHCEIDTNRTHSEFHSSNGVGLHTQLNTNSRFQRFGEQSSELFTRDISGTIFSLIMIVVLVVSMYLLMKHRMQVQTRYLSRRPDLLGACNFPISGSTGAGGRRVELMPTIDDQQAITFPFRNMGIQIQPVLGGDGGPPPYIPPGYRGRRNRNDILPPLPTYEDATKLPPLRQNGIEEDESPIIETNEIDSINNQQLANNNNNNGVENTLSPSIRRTPLLNENHQIIMENVEPSSSTTTTTTNHQNQDNNCNNSEEINQSTTNSLPSVSSITNLLKHQNEANIKNSMNNSSSSTRKQLTLNNHRRNSPIEITNSNEQAQTNNNNNNNELPEQTTL